MKKSFFIVFLLFAQVAFAQNATIASRGTISGSVITLSDNNFKTFADASVITCFLQSDAALWEIASCTYGFSANTLTVNSVISNSSNTTSALTFPSYNTNGSGIAAPVSVYYNPNPVSLASNLSANATQQVLGLLAGRVTSDQATTQLTLQNIPGLSFAIGAGDIYSFDFLILTGSSSTAGIKVGVSYPSGATGAAIIFGTTSGLGTFISEAVGTSGVASANAFNTVISQTGWIRISGSIINGATAGAVQVMADKVTSGTATVRINSHFTAQKIN